MLLPDFSNPDVFFNDDNLFALVDNSVFSVDYMTDEELREAIVEDLLLVTMWEKEYNKKIHFTISHLLSKTIHKNHNRILEEMKHHEISGLISYQNNEIRIKDNREVLQSAMDFCGHWWEGFNIPDDQKVIILNKEEIIDFLKEIGGINKLAEKINTELQSNQLDIAANCNFSKTLQ